MNLLFQILLILGVLKYCCKAGFFKDWRGIVIYSLFASVIAIVFYPVIIKMNTNSFDMLLSDKKKVSDIAVVVTIEAIGGMLTSIGMLHNLFEIKQNMWVKIVKILPGVILLGVVFYIELLLFKTMAGVSFIGVAVLSALLIFIGIAFVAIGIKYLLPEKAMRYELKFLINIILLVVAILMNAYLAGYNESTYEADVEYNKLLVFTGIVVVGFFVGFLLYRKKRFVKKIFCVTNLNNDCRENY